MNIQSPAQVKCWSAIGQAENPVTAKINMRRIIYYVASSLDGYIAGPDADISNFVSSGSGINKYLADLANFDTVIMGRKTYEFGYKFGLKPGQPAYPHMQHYIFSNTLAFQNAHDNVHIIKRELSELEKIRQQQGTDIYLCGGGEFAGWLLDNQKIDELIIKLNPFIQGAGTKLFGESKTNIKLKLKKSQVFDNDLQIMDFDVLYP